MTVLLTEPQDPDRQNRTPPTSHSNSELKQPFDNSELNDIPAPRADDPQYQSWWVEN